MQRALSPSKAIGSVGHNLRTARSSVHSLAGKSFGQILRLRRLCVLWLDIPVYCRMRHIMRALLEHGLGGAFLRRAHFVGKWRTLAWLLRFGPYGDTPAICSLCRGSYRLVLRRQSSARRTEAVTGSLRGGGHLFATLRQSPARRAVVVIGSPRGSCHWLAARRQ